MLIGVAEAAPAVRDAAAQLRCTNLFLIEVAARHPSKREDQWLYVYDEDKLTTRISITEKFSPHNAPPSYTGLLVEVYSSAYRSLPTARAEVARRVQRELVEIGLLENLDAVLSVHVRFVPWGQVIYDHNRRPALDILEPFRSRRGAGRRPLCRMGLPHDPRPCHQEPAGGREALTVRASCPRRS
jgi:protoporphyrinogen oxidase